MVDQTFLTLVSQWVQKKLGPEVTVRHHVIYKNNSVRKDALCILEKGANISPTIYLEAYFAMFQSGASMKEICDRICQEYETNRCCGYLDVSDLCDFGKAKKQIAYKLIHYEKNLQLLREVPHRRFLDLAIVYYILIENSFIGNGTALIHHRQMGVWQVEEEDLYRAAKENTDRLLGNEVQDMRQVVRQLLQTDVERQLAADIKGGICKKEQVDLWVEDLLDNTMPRERVPMYVMSNSDKYMGAAAVLNDKNLKKLSAQWGCGIYVIPSSIHEMILIPDRELICVEEMENLLKEVNEQPENAQDFLSNQVYYYDTVHGLRQTR